MKSDPQLRQDINKLQSENRELRARLKELENKPAKIIEKVVERVVTKRSALFSPDVSLSRSLRLSSPARPRQWL